MSSGNIHPQARIGHVHLKVANLERAIAFYQNVLGVDVTSREGNEAAFLSAGGYHHHIGLNTWYSEGGAQPKPNRTGLFHLAIVYPDRPALAAALKRVLDAGVRLQGASDHSVSEAIYFNDPDGNGIEIYRDRPRDDWPRSASGALQMTTKRLDLDALLAEA